MKKIILWVGILASCLISHRVLAQTSTSSIFVDGLCEMCKKRIETAALKVKGVQSAEWDVENRMLSTTFKTSRFSEDKLHQALSAAGHDTKKRRASDAAYAQLHDCCKYRDPWACKTPCSHHNHRHYHRPKQKEDA